MADTDSPSLDAVELIARARAAYTADGRPPLPDDISDWDIFPFEGDLLVKPLDDPVVPEPPRHGETVGDCSACMSADSDYVWSDAGWRLRTTPQPLPAYLLEPRAHLDLGDLDDSMAAELGVLVVRIERAIASVAGVGRVHVNRWGDGGAHLHVWFFARPEGMLQLRGSCLPDWLDLLPPLPDEQSAAITQHVVARLHPSD
jgi:hypothetical protein